MADSNRHIEALEAELERLRGALSQRDAAAHDVPSSGACAGAASARSLEPPPSFYWLGQVAVTLAVAAFVAGFYVAARNTGNSLVQAGGGALSLLLLGWGLCQAEPGRLGAQGVLACGLGAGFISGLGLLAAHPSTVLRVGMLCLVAAAAVAVRWRESEATFGVVPLLACLGAVPGIGFPGLGPDMALLLCFCVLALAGPRLGTFPIWAAGAAVFAQLALPLALAPATASPARGLAALLLVQSLPNLAALRYTVRGGARVRNAALFVFVNSLLCVAVVSAALESARGAAHPLGMVVTAVLFAVLAGISHRWRPSATLIMACLSTVAMIAAVLGMWSGLPDEFFAPALAAGSAVLVLVFRQSGSVLLRRLEVVSAMAAFGFCLFRLQLGRQVAVGPVTLPANWLNAFGTMFFLCFAATLHEKCFPGGPCRQAHPTKAMARAAMAGLLLLAITVLDRGADTALPFVLGAQSLGMVGLGLVLFTPQIGVAGMLLLVPAHLCYHVFLWQRLPGFVAQPDFAGNTAGLAAFTLAGAAVWERYLRRFHSSTAEWDHYTLVALPFLAAAYLIYTLLVDMVPPAYVPAAMAAVGLPALAPSRLLRLDGLTLGALFCLGAGTVEFGFLAVPSLYDVPVDSGFVPGTAALILLLVAAERLAARLFPGGGAAPNRLAEAIRLLLCLVAVGVAGTGLFAAVRGAVLGWSLSAVALLFVYLGCSCGIRAYGRLAVLLLLCVPVLSFAGVRGMAPGIETVVALVIVGAMAALRLRAGFLRRLRDDNGHDGA